MRDHDVVGPCGDSLGAGAKESPQQQSTRARKACLSGDYQKGVDILTELFIETKDPVMIFNQGRCFEQSGRYEDAISRFEEYLRITKNTGAKDRGEAKEHIVECQAKLDRMRALAPAAAANDTAHDVAAQDAPFVAVDTGPPCNGGCCGHADCPLSAPVCNAANQCVGCTADQNCSGRSATACNTTTGACVQCTKSSQCNGTNAACDLSKNICVGCTQRRDCPGTCQTCIGGTCVALKNVDDPSECTGTCDSAGECKAKKGQKCSSVAGGCITGTTCAPDDTCCDRACTGSCEACDLASAPGTCTVLAAGSEPHAGHAPCSGTGTCAGSCQGASNGACTLPTGACGSSSCTGSTYRAAGTCNQGTCSSPAAVSCKTGATCSAGACACPSGTADCTSSCANLDSDPQNCGACGHDCQGGPCQGGFCKPYKLADVATGRVDTLTVDGNKVYAFTEQTFVFDTTKVWQMDAVTPGVAVRIPPDQTRYPNSVIDGTLVWGEGSDGENIVFSYCSVSGCLASTKKFSHQVPATTAMEVYPVCDVANKEIVWKVAKQPY